jgi:hypothetical protein
MIKEALRKLFGETGATHEQVTAELAEYRVDTIVEALTREGLLPADEHTQQLARQFARHEPEAFAELIRAPRPTPAQGRVYTPPASADPAQQEIERIAAEKNLPLHQAAIEASRGGALKS